MIVVDKVKWNQRQLIDFLHHVPDGEHVIFEDCQFYNLRNLPLDNWPNLSLTFNRNWFAASDERSWVLASSGWRETGPSPEA